MGFFQYKIKSNEKFRDVVNDKFKVDIKKNYLPDQTYINRLIASLNKVEANSYNKSYVGFISEHEYLKEVGFLQSIKEFVDGCLYQLLWINTILESGKVTSSEEELEEKFDYITPSMPGNPWTLNEVTKKGVFFRGDEPFQDSRVIINSENIIEITIALSTVTQQYGEHIAAEKSKQAKSVAISSPKASESSLFKSKDLEIKCLNVLKEIKHPILDIDGNFIGDSGMKSAIVVWYYICSRLNLINKNSDNRDVVARKVMKIIPDLKIGGSLFHKDLVAKKYKDDIEEKLAQFSRK